MTKEQAIVIATRFAISNGFKIGKISNVRYVPIFGLDKLWEPEFAKLENPPKQWRILFELEGTNMDPGDIIVLVNDMSGRVLIDQFM